MKKDFDAYEFVNKAIQTETTFVSILGEHNQSNIFLLFLSSDREN